MSRRSAIAGDGSLVALAFSHGPDSGEVRVWMVADGLERLRYDRVASALAFSPDGGLLADGDLSGRVEVRETDSWRRVAKLYDRPPFVSRAWPSAAIPSAIQAAVMVGFSPKGEAGRSDLEP